MGLVGALLPGVRVGIDAYVGAGDSQVAFTAWDSARLGLDEKSDPSLYLVWPVCVAAAVLVAARLSSRSAAALLALLGCVPAALVLVKVGQLWDNSAPHWPVPHAGGHGCEHVPVSVDADALRSGQVQLRCGGPLQPTLEGVLDDLERRRPTPDGILPYRTEPLVGVWLVFLSAAATVWVCAARAVQLTRLVPRLRRWQLALLLAALAATAFAGQLAAAVVAIAENCYGSDSWSCDGRVGDVGAWVFVIATAAIVSVAAARLLPVLSRTRSKG